jgi:translation initiation factor IF-1
MEMQGRNAREALLNMAGKMRTEQTNLVAGDHVDYRLAFRPGKHDYVLCKRYSSRLFNVSVWPVLSA